MSAASRSRSWRWLTGRRFTSTTRRRCETGHGPMGRRWPATPARHGRCTPARRMPPSPSCASCSTRAWGWTSPRRASSPMPSPPARRGSGSSSTATTSRTPTSGPRWTQRPACSWSTMSRSSTRSSGSQPRPGEGSRSCSVSRRVSRPRRTPRSARHTRRRSSGSPPPTSWAPPSAPPRARTCGSTACTCTWARRSAISTRTSRRWSGWPGSRERRAGRCSTSAAASRSPTPTTTTPPICAPPPPQPSRPSPSGSTRPQSSCSSPVARLSARAGSRSTRSGP